MTNEPTSPVSDVVGDRVREVRQHRGLTAKQLAERCAAQGIAQLSGWTIMNIENGRRDPNGRRRRDVTVDELLALSVALEVSPLDLLVPPYPSPLWTGQLGMVRDGGEAHYYAADRPAEPLNSPNDDQLYRVTPTVEAPIWRVRQYIRGGRPLDGQDPWAFYAERPLHERPTERLKEGDDDGRR